MRSLKDLAVFIRDNHLQEAGRVNLQFARETDVPLLKFFAHLPEEQLQQMSCEGLREFFTLMENDAHVEKAKESIQQWERDELPNLPRSSVHVSDLIYIYAGQKRTVIHFLPQFTSDVTEAVAIVAELEDYYATVQDMAFHTMIRIYSEELKVKNDELLRSNTELEQFAYVSSHDLQEPLRKIRAFGDRLSDKYSEALGDDGRMYVSIMQNAAARMHVLINDLLKFSRLSRDKEVFTRLSLNTIVDDSLSDLEISIEQTKATVHVGRLPAVDIIPGQMRQLFQNIIGNALKFHRPDVPPVVEVHAEILPGRALPGLSSLHAAANFCRIYIRDNGIGFKEQYAERIFVVFQRLHGRQAYHGTGIGLAVCKKIVDNHRGFITAISKENEGSTFVITIPVKQNNESKSQTDQKS